MSSDSAYSFATPSSSRTPSRTIPSPPPLDRGQEFHNSPYGVELPEEKKRKKKKKNSEKQRNSEPPLSLKGQILQVLAMAFIAWLVATWGFKSVDMIRQQLKPFCDSDTNEAEISDACIPCPENGWCRDGRLDCFPGYKRAKKLCVEDKGIDQTAEKLADYLRSRVCSLAARSVCDGGASGAVWLTDDDAQTQLKEEGLQERFGLDDGSWLLVWEKIAAITEDSVTTQNELDGKREFRCPGDLVQRYKPLTCQIREWIMSHILIFLAASPVIIVMASVISKSLKKSRAKARAEQVYLQVCEALEEKALEAGDQVGREPWVVVSRLRDHLLWPGERKWAALWTQVEALVNEDSRIDQYQRKVKGEMKVVWEWQVEGALRTPARRKPLGRLYTPQERDSHSKIKPIQI